MIPKAERDADRAICEAATRGAWQYSDAAGVHVADDDGWTSLAFPEYTLDVSERANGVAICNAVNRLPLYIAALDDIERRINAIDSRRGEYAASEERADRQHAAGMREALKILRGEK